jgi:uncharacterized membrane protein YeiB
MSTPAGEASAGDAFPRDASPRAGAGWLTAPSRLGGLDLARGLAVLGMLAAHLLAIDDFEWTRPATWTDVVNGRSSILFATAAGVSIALVTGGPTPPGEDAARGARARLAVRAAVIWIIGIALVLTGVPVFVILPAYAVLFLLALPLLRLTAPVLWAIAAATALVMPWLQPTFDALAVWQGATGSDLALLLGWHYPFPVWFAYLAAGLAAGRSDLRRVRTQVALLAGGALAAGAAYGAEALSPPVLTASTVWTADAHSQGILEVIGSGGFALAVIGAALLLCRTPLAWAVLPLRAVGAMPLTAYVGQIVAWALAAGIVLGDTSDLGGFRALHPLGAFVTTTLVLCTAWALLWGRGPMERLVTWVTRLAGPRRGVRRGPFAQEWPG